MRYIRPFPAPEGDQIRYAIHVPTKPHEENLKVELRATKKATVDGVNKFWYLGNLDKKILEGWGFNYYTMDHVSDSPRQTSMEGIVTERVESVSVNLDGKTLFRYNSRLPIVVYAPKDVSLNYVIWHADDVAQNASEG